MSIQYAGVSVEQLQEQMSKGTVSADDLQFYDGECIWAPLQLETELAGGAWICVKMKEEDLVRLQQDPMRSVLFLPFIVISQALLEVARSNIHHRYVLS